VVVAKSAWDLAVECVEEALEGGVVPSLAHLGRLGQLGSLPSFVAALLAGDEPCALGDDYARERESLGLAPAEIAAELLVLGRVLERAGEPVAREALDTCLVAYVARVTGDLAERASRDGLTGLLNHRAFHTRVTDEIARARRYRGRLALVVFDLDGFKETNDTEGHAEGDRLLRAFAAALTATARQSDPVGRLGGDEFAALLVQGDASSVAAFRERLAERLPSGVAVSSGAAYLPEVPFAADRLFALADRRLYEAKATRRAA
jgi:diguanylate cyclase (GGDEF)-like protein